MQNKNQLSMSWVNTAWKYLLALKSVALRRRTTFVLFLLLNTSAGITGRQSLTKSISDVFGYNVIALYYWEKSYVTLHNLERIHVQEWRVNYRKKLFSPGPEIRPTAELIPGVWNPLLNITKIQKLLFLNEISVEEHIGQKTKGSKSVENGLAP